MPPRVPPSRIAQALEYLQGLKSGVGEFVGGVGSNLADRAKAAGGLAYEALTSDPNMGRMNTAEFSEAAANRQTPRLDQAARDIGIIGKAIVTQPVETGKAIVRGEVDRAKGAMTSPQAAGQYAGSFVDPLRLAKLLGGGTPDIAELDVYHGTPHRFPATEANPLGEFDASKVGTGEGAQAYGHGIYLAESPDVAKGYKERLSGSNPNVFLFDGKEVSISGGLPEFKKFAQIAKSNGFSRESAVLAYNTLQEKGGDLTGASSQLSWKEAPNPFDDEAANLLRSLDLKPEGGALYKADLPDQMIDRMLDWDKPLSEQPKVVQQALAKLDPDSYSPEGMDYSPEEPGQMIYMRIANSPLAKNQAEASAALKAAGIPGLRYLDAGSRGKDGTGTRNFVVFPGEEKKVKILERK